MDTCSGSTRYAAPAGQAFVLTTPGFHLPLLFTSAILLIPSHFRVSPIPLIHPHKSGGFDIRNPSLTSHFSMPELATSSSLSAVPILRLYHLPPPTVAMINPPSPPPSPPTCCDAQVLPPGSAPLLQVLPPRCSSPASLHSTGPLTPPRFPSS